MKLEQQVCTSQQAEKLKELGVSAPSLHHWWKMKYPASEEAFAKNRANCLITPTGDNHDRFIMHYIDNENASFHWEEGTYSDGWDHSRCELEEGPLPAYNVAELGEMLPDLIEQEGKQYEFVTIKEDDCWLCRYVRNNNMLDCFHYAAGTTEAESRANMLEYLIESKLLKVEDINNRLKQSV